MTRRRFFPLLGTLAGCFFTLSLAQCNDQTGGESIQKLRTILNQVEASLKILIAFGLANDVIAQAAKYLETVTAFVNGAAEVLENVALSLAEKAAKIVALSATVALPHFEDARVQNALLKVQTAVDAFVAIWRAVNPPEVKLTDATKKLLDQIEHDAQKDGHDVEQWAASHTPIAPHSQNWDWDKAAGNPYVISRGANSTNIVNNSGNVTVTH